MCAREWQLDSSCVGNYSFCAQHTPNALVEILIENLSWFNLNRAVIYDRTPGEYLKYRRVVINPKGEFWSVDSRIFQKVACSIKSDIKISKIIKNN